MKNHYTCHDCGAVIDEGTTHARYQAGENTFTKCASCYAQDPVLRNFQKAEVYSRIVGYIRPVAQWNNGKQAEFCDRETYAPSVA